MTKKLTITDRKELLDFDTFDYCNLQDLIDFLQKKNDEYLMLGIPTLGVEYDKENVNFYIDVEREETEEEFLARQSYEEKMKKEQEEIEYRKYLRLKRKFEKTS